MEQTAAHVKEGLKSGRWAGVMPGTPKLAAECGVSRVTMTAALKLLEAEGVLEPTTPGKARQAPKGKQGSRRKKALRVAVLLRQRLKDEDADQQLLFLKLRSDLEKAGHVCVFATRTLVEMRDKVGVVRREVEKVAANAWIVCGPALEVAEWFSSQPFPTLFLGGQIPGNQRHTTLGWDASGACSAALKRLKELGHHRIVVLFADIHQKRPHSKIREFLSQELGLAGPEAESYHFPEWEETPEGLQKVLGELFHFTPPTALILMRSRWTLGVVSFLGRRGLKVPEDVSLLAAAMDSNHVWHHPRLAYLGTSDEAYLREIEKWVEGVSKGVVTYGRIVVPGIYSEGETVARAPQP